MGGGVDGDGDDLVFPLSLLGLFDLSEEHEEEDEREDAGQEEAYADAEECGRDGEFGVFSEGTA